MKNQSFKERVRKIAINEAHNYKATFVDCEYLVCSDAFLIKDYYIISSEKNNYLHLIGVNALISPLDFFEKCINGSLEESDFNFIKRGQAEGEVKGSVRRKILVLPKIMTLFTNDLIVQENFKRNKLVCSFVASKNNFTIGFVSIDKEKTLPNTLLTGNILDPLLNKDVKLLLRRKKGLKKFNEILIGDFDSIIYYFDKIKSLIDDSIIQQLKIA